MNYIDSELICLVLIFSIPRKAGISLGKRRNGTSVYAVRLLEQ